MDESGRRSGRRRSGVDEDSDGDDSGFDDAMDSFKDRRRRARQSVGSVVGVDERAEVVAVDAGSVGVRVARHVSAMAGVLGEAGAFMLSLALLGGHAVRGFSMQGPAPAPWRGDEWLHEAEGGLLPSVLETKKMREG